jgi:hypothetical protein
VWTSLADYLAGLGDTYDVKEAVQRQEDANDSAWEYARLHVRKTLGGLLSPIQIKLLPWESGLLYRSAKPIRIRMFSP